jgi:hypothetical protein
MNRDLPLGILLGALLGVLHGAAQAVPVVPNFTSGTMTSHTETTTTLNETIHQIDYQTGWSYTATGTNINVPSSPSVNTPYTINVQGAPFQFSETYTGPGMIKETTVQRQTTVFSVTDSTSVFTQ